MAKRKPPQHISFGDLISVDNYEGRLFFVDGWTVEHIFAPDEQYTEVWYDVTDAHTGEYMMAEVEDITRICGADQADEYLKNNVSPPRKAEMPDLFDQIFGGVPKMKAKEPRKPSAREISGQEAEKRKQERKEKARRIDELLDEMNDYTRLADEFGDEEYKGRVEYLTVKLTEITSEGEQ